MAHTGNFVTSTCQTYWGGGYPVMDQHLVQEVAILHLVTLWEFKAGLVSHLGLKTDVTFCIKSSQVKGWPMVSRKLWVSKTFDPISKSRIVFVTSHEDTFFACCCLSHSLKSFKSQSRIFKQESWHLGESQILPFATLGNDFPGFFP